MRREDWEARLNKYLEGKRDEPFEYGVNDCCTFIAGAVEAETGKDPMPEFRGKYDSLKSSLRALRDIGEGNLEATMDSKFETVDPSHAQRGDLAFFDGSVGVVTGQFAWFVSDEGLERVPRGYWDKGWKVN